VRRNLFGRFKELVGATASCEVTNGKYYWDIFPNWFTDIGTIDKPRELRVIYTAPQIKPNPNVATVTLPFALEHRGDTYEPPHRGMLISRITIIDRGYRATGTAGGGVVFAGVVCDLNAPFSIDARSPLMTFPLKFEPSSPTAGAWRYTATIPHLQTSGGGNYTVDQPSADHSTLIRIVGSSNAKIPVISAAGGGPATIQLVPLESGECTQP
jgi:hypothetical protein